MRAILQHEGQWLCFEHPKKILKTRHLEEVLPLLEEAENSNLFVAGFVSYEAAPAFDSAFQTRPNHSFPLLYLGLFPPPILLDHLEAVSSFELGERIPDISKATFTKKMEHIKKEIAAGATYQVNYTHRLKAPFFGDAFSFFSTLVHGQKTQHAAFIQTEDFSICSASPELFFHQKGKEIIMRPMKGTAPRALTFQEDEKQRKRLQNSSKDRAENIMIVDMIRNDLGRVAIPGSVEVENPFHLEKYPTVWQMTSTVKAQLKTPSLSSLFKALFPCASITGAPKAKTMEIIRNLESSPRNIYTGAIGFSAPNKQESCFNVAIRTALIHHKMHQLEYGVGGGIVWDSLADSEWEETQSKALILTQPHPEFQLIETMLWEPKTGIFLLKEHLKRLSDSANYFDIPLDLNALRCQIDRVTKGLKEYPHKVRLLLFQTGKFSLESTPFSLPSSPVRISISDTPISEHSPFLFHKTTLRTCYETAKKMKPDVDDVILWNAKNEVTESTIANVVIKKGNQFYTPPISAGLLPGTFRSHLLAKKKIQEKVIHLNELKTADELFLINALRKWQPASLI